GLGLRLDYGDDRLGEALVIGLLVEAVTLLPGAQELLQLRRPDQAADMGGEDALGTAFHAEGQRLRCALVTAGLGGNNPWGLAHSSACMIANTAKRPYVQAVRLVTGKQRQWPTPSKPPSPLASTPCSTPAPGAASASRPARSRARPASPAPTRRRRSRACLISCAQATGQKVRARGQVPACSPVSASRSATTASPRASFSTGRAFRWREPVTSRASSARRASRASAWSPAMSRISPRCSFPRRSLRASARIRAPSLLPPPSRPTSCSTPVATCSRRRTLRYWHSTSWTRLT